MGCSVHLTPQFFLLVYPHANVGPPTLPAAASPIPPATAWLQVLSIWLPISAPPTSLDECFFFNSLVVGLLYSSIFWQFCFCFFKICCCPSFGCLRRHSGSTYASILARSHLVSSDTFNDRLLIKPHWRQSCLLCPVQEDDKFRASL